MKSGTTAHPAERLVEWAAPAMLAVAAGWSAWMMLGLPLAAAGAGVPALVAGFAAMRFIGGAGSNEGLVAFEPVPFEESPGEELLLDDPLTGFDPNSRVVRLFAREDATPGEMVARIADYLADGERATAALAEEGSAAPPDASAALHAALANIRASLR